jgi:hypothetical protein
MNKDKEEQTERKEIETDRARGNEEKKRQTGSNGTKSNGDIK